jgi:hypothetical protein
VYIKEKESTVDLFRDQKLSTVEFKMVGKDIVAEERVEDALPPIEAVMYHEKHHLNAEAVDEIQAYRSAGALGDGYTEKMDRRLLWKIDFRLIPMLAIIYGICVIDRYSLRSMTG